ncbi:serine/threonine protein kinase [Candidatus Woesearchaeota archaeon]|nr:serine/threonine protein kinase [Candidatus Woesearchaeota archaeon]|tara:strand:+ start:360 stop:1061 length:702 start_codon:yes stop_codon:yes gene_type:complete
MAVSKEKWKVYKNVFSSFSLRTLFTLASQGHFIELKSPISIGKEANIYSAETNEGNLVVVKIYRLENCNFNKMKEYLRLDNRYHGKKFTSRGTVFNWVQREYRNLLLSRDAVPVPIPLAFKNNVLVMEFIGSDGKAAPMLKDAEIRDPEKTFEKIMENVCKLWKQGLVHGDLSEFNILLHKNVPVFIDFSQATPTKNSFALELLDRDILNICSFFSKRGVKTNKEKEKEKVLS